VYVESRRSDPYTLDYLPPGRTNPIHCTSLGKALTAFLPPDTLQDLVARISFEARTPQTITSPQAFLQCLEEVRRDGFAVDNEENGIGWRCVGAPVRDYTGRVVAAISVTGLAAQLRTETVPEVAEVVVEAAQEISRALGWIPGMR
jgi:IclR family acetate operon transcriptional repressor